MNLINQSQSENEDFSKFNYLGIFIELEKLAKEYPNYLHLSDCNPPVYGYTLDESILKQVDQLRISQYSGYSSWNGDEKLRIAINQRIRKMSGAELPVNKIVPTYGVSEGFPLTFATLFHLNPGSVAIPDPSYVPLIIQARRFGKIWFYHCDEEDEWNPDLNRLIISLERHPDTRAIVIITPNSPTGAVYSEKTIKEIINIAGQYNLIIITNEIYDSISFTDFCSPLQYANEIPVIYLNGFSKVYRLPGYRLGYIGWYDPTEKVAGFWDYLEHLCRGRFGITPLAQEIAKLALQEPENALKAYVESVHKKQIFLAKHLEAIEGVTVVPAKGGTYVFPKINLKIKDEDVAKFLIKNYGIFVTPGSVYGPIEAPGHLRFVTLAPEEDLLKGIHALKGTLKEFI